MKFWRQKIEKKNLKKNWNFLKKKEIKKQVLKKNRFEEKKLKKEIFDKKKVLKKIHLPK